MPSERLQRRIDALLDEIETLQTAADWAGVSERADEILELDPENADALAFKRGAQRRSQTSFQPAEQSASAALPALPASFVGGRYAVRRYLGEGGRKRVYLSHDSRLDREVAFCAIRTEGLDLVGHERVRREAQAMGRLGGHRNLVPIYDVGDENGTPYIVEEFMSGGDVAGLLEQAEDHRLPVERTLAIAKDVCGGLAFIHSGGLVHRDLKPANVFLSADGTAKIGDFGLAVALDRSRLTQHGLMLGTVAYMPPEQALGGESAPRADLYSLGAMLYEMVTGRPPFVGQDPTAVISQHINTAPVAPSWMTESCPPSLEELILHLLEKDPGKRPASAVEVLAVLEQVDPTEKSASHSESNALDRLARGVFVGREKELERLRTAFDEVFAGRGRLVMLVGEPGIGKTRTVQELETYARMRGAQVLWGANHESSGAPPFYPFIQVGRQWGAATGNDLSVIRPIILNDGSDLVRLFPELREALPGLPEPMVLGDAAAAQFRLFEAYTNFVRAISERQPMVITLDDLHWADKPTLQLLQHLSRDLARMRVLVVCTYRDTDVTRKSALSETLAALTRDPGFERLVLRGLGKHEVRAYIAGAAHLEPGGVVLDRIFEETEGNPFFLTEVVNLLTQEGSLGRDSVSDIAVPDGVRDALGRRLDRISPETNEILQVAAVAGREFAYDTLTLLGDRESEELLKLIEEAVEARVIEEMEQPGRYRFTHALMQETLLGELSTTRRVRLHGQVGEALEKRWGDRANDYASRLAVHFGEAATLTPQFKHKAIRYGAAAGRQALGQSAFPEAARQFRTVLATADEWAIDDDLAEILTDYATAAYASADHREGWRAAGQAFDHWERTRNAPAAVKTALIPTPRTGYVKMLQRALALVDEASPDSGFLHAALGEAIGVTGTDDAAAQEAFAVAWAVATRLGLKQLELKLLLAEAAVDFQQFRPRDWFRKSEMAATLAQELNEPLSEEKAHNLAATNCDPGLRDVGREHASAARALAERSRDLARVLEATHSESVVAQFAGDWETVRNAVTRALAIDAHSVNHLGSLAEVELQTGNFEKARAAVSRFEANTVRVRGVKEWKTLSAGMAAYVTGTTPPEPVTTIPEPSALSTPLLESLALIGISITAHLVDDRAAADELLRRLERFAGWWILGLTIDHVRGLLFETLDQPDRAIDAMERTLSYPQTGYGFRPYWSWAALDCARIRFHRAEVGDRERALELVAQALDHARALGMKPLVDRLLSLRLLDQGIPNTIRSSIVAVNAAIQSEHPNLRQQAAPDGTVTLLFSDIENSTPLNEQMGDAAWLEILREHNAAIDAAVAAHRGFVVKTMGDGYMVAFKSAADGLRCAIAIQQALQGGEPIRVRIGLHTGEVLRKGDDFFGRHVNFAARVAGHALGREVLVSGVVHELVAGQGFEFEDCGERMMKGFEEPVRVWRVRWEEA